MSDTTTANGADECVAGLRGMAEILDRIEVRVRVAQVGQRDILAAG